MVQLFTKPPERPRPPRQIREDIPLYRLEAKLWIDIRMYDEGQYMYFLGEPNEYMWPLNKLAVEKMREFLAKLDAASAKSSEATKRSIPAKLPAFERRLQDFIAGKAPEGQDAPIFSNKIEPKRTVGFLAEDTLDDTYNLIQQSLGKTAIGEATGMDTLGLNRKKHQLGLEKKEANG